MNAIQFAIARAGRQSGIPCSQSCENGLKRQPLRPMVPVSEVARSIKVPPGIRKPRPEPSLTEDQRMAIIEGKREAVLLAEAEHEARRRRISRCEEEIRKLEARPDDIPEMAYLVTMGIEDWRAEKRLIESEVL